MTTAASMPRWGCRGACGVSSNSNRSRHMFRRNLIPDLLILGVPILRTRGKDEVSGGVSPRPWSLVHKAKICKIVSSMSFAGARGQFSAEQIQNRIGRPIVGHVGSGPASIFVRHRRSFGFLCACVGAWHHRSRGAPCRSIPWKNGARRSLACVRRGAARSRGVSSGG